MGRIVLLATGGTIASRASAQGRRVSAGAAELLRSALEVDGLGATVVETRDVSATAGFAVDVPGALALVRTVRAAVNEADGVVVTHGTDTLEEVAFLLALAHAGRAPVVVTGAQRPFDDPAPDGPRNLSAALRWAASPASAGSGVMIAFADAILPAIGVRKTHALALDAFSAPDRGPSGHVDEAGVRHHHFASPPGPLLTSDLVDLPRVEVVAQYLGCDGSQVGRAVQAGARGLVVAAFGAGNATPGTVRACLQALETGTPVIVAGRTGAGAVTGLYAGGGADLAEAGAIFAGDLSPWQARLLLAVALAPEPETPDVEAVAWRCRTWLRAAGAIAAED
ncbi:asparaginase [Marinactinospora endophytica]